MGRIIFITGTDTGVGKTVLTTLLLLHLRNSGIKALAMKPFCCGDSDDIEAIKRIQGDELPQELLNLYYFKEPLAPSVAARNERKTIHWNLVVAAIRRARNRCECLIVEGIGGALVPITKHLTIADLAVALDSEVSVVAKNKLGTLNHTFLTIEALRNRGIRRMKIILMGQSTNDASTKTNARTIAETVENIDVFTLPFLLMASDLESRKASRSKKNQKNPCTDRAP